MVDITNVLKGCESERCQKCVKPLLDMSSNEEITKSFDSRVAKCDDSYSNYFELKISQIISKLQSDYVV